MMKDLECGSCIQCCEWGDDTAIHPLLSSTEADELQHEVIKGQLRLAANPDGDCVYLLSDGCSIYNRRPDQCKRFDCRHLYEQMKDATFIKVIIKGAVMSA